MYVNTYIYLFKVWLSVYLEVVSMSISRVIVCCTSRLQICVFSMQTHYHLTMCFSSVSHNQYTCNEISAGLLLWPRTMTVVLSFTAKVVLLIWRFVLFFSNKQQFHQQASWKITFNQFYALFFDENLPHDLSNSSNWNETKYKRIVVIIKSTALKTRRKFQDQHVVISLKYQNIFAM